MNVHLGQRVVTRDGHDLGNIRYVLFDPEGNTARAVVVEKGFLLKEDRELSIGDLQEQADGTLVSNLSAAEAEKLPHFHEVVYAAAPDGFVGVAGVPTAGTLWPAAYPATGYVGGYPYQAAFPAFVVSDADAGRSYSEEEAIYKQLDRENAVIKAGDKVVGGDGETVGEVSDVEFDGQTGRLLRFTVRKGFLFTEDTTLPAEAVASVDDGVVYLKLDARPMEQPGTGKEERAA